MFAYLEIMMLRYVSLSHLARGERNSDLDSLAIDLSHTKEVPEP
jgi:hypothetical protein